MLAVLLGFAGLYIIKKYENDNRKYYAIILFTLTLFIKQSNIVAPAAGIIYMFLKDKKQAIIFTVILGISGLIILILINILSNGNFVNHIFKYHIVDYSFLRLSLFAMLTP